MTIPTPTQRDRPLRGRVFECPFCGRFFYRRSSVHTILKHMEREWYQSTGETSMFRTSENLEQTAILFEDAGRLEEVARYGITGE